MSSLKCGIIGLPNVGKSSLFNALTSSLSADMKNYPFCTIDPNVGIVNVPDSRLDKISSISNSEKTIPTTLNFVDIAGLVKGAHKGEGLGNKFLSHIRQVDALIHVLRCFEDKNISHVEGNIDPIKDAEVIETELILADILSLESKKKSLEKYIKSQDKEAIQLNKQITNILNNLNKGIPVRQQELDFNTKELFLLTDKPLLYVCNVDEEYLQKDHPFSQQIKTKAEKENNIEIKLSIKVECDIANIKDQQERKEFLEDLGLKFSGLEQIIQEGYKLLNLITFFTSGKKETRAWTIQKGTKAPEAAGKIHTDMEKGFIAAEIIAYKDFYDFNGEHGAKKEGKARQEGKEYIMKNGDICLFRFNV